MYLDNSSTTKPCERSIEFMNDALTNVWGNPSSLHRLGMEAEIAVSESRHAVAKLIRCRDDEIYFTGCGTESNNTALMSVLARKHAGNRIITSSIEHPSVLECCKHLSELGYDVVYLKPDKNGIISLNELENALNERTALVSIMLVNNEIGSVQPIKEAVALTRKSAPNAYFHTDAVQGFGKLPINVQQMGVDMLSASGHKVNGPKGIGFLYCKKGIKASPLIRGGGQERGMRSGTESVPLICGLHGAVADIPDLSKTLAEMRALCDYAKNELLKTGFVTVNSPDSAIPYILNISVKGYRSETLLHYLESKNIYVSSGSACSKGHKSYVLTELGLSSELTDSALRISFGRYNNKNDVDCLCEALNEAVKKIRKANV